MSNSAAASSSPAPAITTRRNVAAQNILRRAVVLVLECHYLGNHRKVKLDDAVKAATNGKAKDVNKDVEKQLNVTKKLVDGKVLTRALAVPDNCRTWLRTKAIPAHRVFGERAYLVPVEMVQEIDARLCAFKAEILDEARKVSEIWDGEVEKQRAVLGPSLFRRSDYPSADEVRDAFDIDWSYVSFAAPERLEHVDHALFEGAQRKYEAKMAEAYAEVKTVLRETLRQLTSEIAAKLAPGDDGKPKTFRNSILSGLSDFLDSFQFRNISDDRELEAVVRRLKMLTKDVDPEQLREIDALRSNVLSGMKQATDQLDKLVATGRGRGISFGSI